MSTYDLELHQASAEVVVATLAGELDLTNAHELEERLDAAAVAEALLVVDINRVVFLDSAALHVFFKLARQRGDSRMVLLMKSDAAMARTLDIVGMKDAVRVVASLDDLELAETG